jgi:hypothetical protein
MRHQGAAQTAATESGTGCTLCCADASACCASRCCDGPIGD